MPPTARLIRTRAMNGIESLTDTQWATDPSVAWIRRGEGMMGWGVAAQANFRGAERFSRAQRWVSDWLAQCRIHDDLGIPRTGMMAFASFTFTDDSYGSTVVIPRTLIGVRDGLRWRTEVTFDGEPDNDDAVVVEHPQTKAETHATWHDETASSAAWQAAVGESVKRIAAGELDKVVLAREVRADFAQPVALQPLLRRLAERYPQCWTFYVDGLVGATPELLVRRQRDQVTSRVLAGSVAASSSDQQTDENAKALQSSSKNLLEHEYAVRSVAHALAVHCTDLEVPSAPAVLQLANVQHLATDIRANLADGSSALALAASLHPTAAVCGTPTERARLVIRELEGIDRGRYSGPVGWIDGNSDGEFAIALRCAQLGPDARTARLFAGCGLVADSDAEAELAESETKLQAMRWALGERQ